MKKCIAIVLLCVFTIISCEVDDICIDGSTPKLIIRFYDNSDTTKVKSINLDSVWVENKLRISDYKGVSIDSIAIPLDLNEDQTTYIISNNKIKDTLKFSYTRNDVFVSRSCGYKTIYENFQLESNTINWIKDISSKNSTIEDETAAHITISH